MAQRGDDLVLSSIALRIASLLVVGEGVLCGAVSSHARRWGALARPNGGLLLRVPLRGHPHLPGQPRKCVGSENQIDCVDPLQSQPPTNAMSHGKLDAILLQRLVLAPRRSLRLRRTAAGAARGA